MFRLQRITFLFSLWITIESISIAQINTPWPLDADRTSDNAGLGSIAGQSIRSWPVDPFMTSAQERRILSALLSPADLGPLKDVPLEEFCRSLKRRLPIQIDIRALDDLGLTVDIPINFDLDDRPAPDAMNNSQNADGNKPDNNKRSSDANDPPEAPDAVEQESVDDDKEVEPWWRQTPGQPATRATIDTVGALFKDDQATAISLGAALSSILDDIDLTMSISRGQLIITTRDAAESQLAVRIYDVTPLIDPSKRRPMRQQDMSSVPMIMGNASADFSNLVDVISASIVPDTWETLGGPSTMAARIHRDRMWLVIATTSDVHWQVQELLDRLNQNPAYSSAGQ